MATYDIAGIRLAFTPLFSEFFATRLPMFRSTTTETIPQRRLRTAVGPIGDLPAEEPVFSHQSKVMYRKEDRYSLYLYESADRSRLMQKITYDAEYRDIDILMSPEYGDRLPEIEYLATGMFFFEMAIREGFFPFHASALRVGEDALLFSAPSGVGKSTHAELWKQYLPEVGFLNDDKPLLSFQNGILCASGTPWSGKTDRTMPLTLPVKAIVFLSRGTRPRVRLLGESLKLALLMKNGFRSRESQTADRILVFIDRILATPIPILAYETDISQKAFTVLYDYLYGGSRS
jgi:hypothetical protein